MTLFEIKLINQEQLEELGHVTLDGSKRYATEWKQGMDGAGNHVRTTTSVRVYILGIYLF